MNPSRADRMVAVMPKSAQSIIVIALISLGTIIAREHYMARTGKSAH